MLHLIPAITTWPLTWYESVGTTIVVVIAVTREEPCTFSVALNVACPAVRDAWDSPNVSSRGDKALQRANLDALGTINTCDMAIFRCNSPIDEVLDVLHTVANPGARKLADTSKGVSFVSGVGLAKVHIVVNATPAPENPRATQLHFTASIVPRGRVLLLAGFVAICVLALSGTCLLRLIPSRPGWIGVVVLLLAACIAFALQKLLRLAKHEAFTVVDDLVRALGSSFRLLQMSPLQPLEFGSHPATAGMILLLLVVAVTACVITGGICITLFFSALLLMGAAHLLLVARIGHGWQLAIAELQTPWSSACFIIWLPIGFLSIPASMQTATLDTDIPDPAHFRLAEFPDLLTRSIHRFRTTDQTPRAFASETLTASHRYFEGRPEWDRVLPEAAPLATWLMSVGTVGPWLVLSVLTTVILLRLTPMPGENWRITRFG